MCTQHLGSMNTPIVVIVLHTKIQNHKHHWFWIICPKLLRCSYIFTNQFFTNSCSASWCLHLIIININASNGRLFSRIIKKIFQNIFITWNGLNKLHNLFVLCFVVCYKWDAEMPTSKKRKTLLNIFRRFRHCHFRIHISLFCFLAVINRHNC